MSRLKGRGRRGDWKQAQNRNALNLEALSLPSLNCRPYLLHVQLQIALNWLQDSLQTCQEDAEAAWKQAGPSFLSHIRQCLKFDKHGNWSLAILVWELLSCWEAFRAYFPRLEDDFAAACSQCLSTDLFREVVQGLGWQQQIQDALELSALIAIERASLVALLTQSRPPGSENELPESISTQLHMSQTSSSDAVALGQSEEASLWSRMVAKPETHFTMPATGKRDNMSGLLRGAPASGPRWSGEAAATGETVWETGYEVWSSAQAVVGCMPCHPVSWAPRASATPQSISCSQQGCETKDNGWPLRKLSEPDWHSPLCMATAFLEMAEAGVSRRGKELGSTSTEAVEQLLHSAANAAACVGASEQRKALLEAVVAGQEFAELHGFVAGSAAIKESVGRGLVAFSNRMIAGPAEKAVFDELPAWVSARAQEVTPLAMMDPHSTLSRLVSVGLRNASQGQLLVEIIQELEPLLKLPPLAAGQQSLLLDLLAAEFRAADSNRSQPLLQFLGHLSRPRRSGGVFLDPTLEPSELLTQLLLPQLLDCARDDNAKLSLCLRATRVLLLEGEGEGLGVARAGALSTAVGCFARGQVQELLFWLRDTAMGRLQQQLDDSAGAPTEGHRVFATAISSAAADLVEDLVLEIVSGLRAHKGDKELREASRKLLEAARSMPGIWTGNLPLLPLLVECLDVSGDSQTPGSVLGFLTAEAARPRLNSKFQRLQEMARLLAFSCTSNEAAEAVDAVLGHGQPWEGERSPPRRGFLDLAGNFVDKAVESQGVSGGGLLTAAVARTLHAMSERQAGRVCCWILPPLCSLLGIQDPASLLWDSLYLLATAPAALPFPFEVPGGPSEERRAAVESALLAIAAYCSPTSSSVPHGMGQGLPPIDGFARACAVTAALQPVYSCGAMSALLPELLKVLGVLLFSSLFSAAFTGCEVSVRFSAAFGVQSELTGCMTLPGQQHKMEQLRGCAQQLPASSLRDVLLKMLEAAKMNII